MKIAWLGLLLAASGCARSAPPASANAPAPAQQPAAEVPPVAPDNSSVVRIADDIRKACGLTDAEAYFAYNSADARSAAPLFDALATCFTTGPLAGRQMRLVGYADPRGDDEYNMVLGARRADNVQRVLLDKGVLAKQVTTTSRGEMDARGTDEAGWARDRRVDVLLGEAGD